MCYTLPERISVLWLMLVTPWFGMPSEAHARWFPDVETRDWMFERPASSERIQKDHTDALCKCGLFSPWLFLLLRSCR